MEYAQDYSGYGNEVLYKMCADKPKHTDVDVIHGKLWIIGRSYSVAIERRRAGSNFTLENTIKMIQNSKIDKLLDEVLKIDFPDEKNIEIILNTHKYFTDLLKEATGLEKRSLASKYLHFHAPKAFFIYDSIVEKKISKILKEKKIKIKNNKRYDDKYSAFVYKCLYYRDNILNKVASPREIDTALYPQLSL